MVGSALQKALEACGHSVLALKRGAVSAADDVAWDPGSGRLEGSGLKAVDAVIHLAGANIAGRRWSKAWKQEIRNSRVDATRRLCESLAQLGSPPKVFLGASAVGFYGSRGDEVLNEESSLGTGFLAEVAQDWERASQGLAQRCGTRVAHLRLGMVLSPEGGALRSMLPPFRFGLGGRLGRGNQWWSWMTLVDVIQAVRMLLEEPLAKGAFNLVSPQPVSNLEFTRTLGRVIQRPTIFPAPAPVLRLILGEMADALLLSSVRVQPTRLEAMGFQWTHPTLEPALRALLKP